MSPALVAAWAWQGTLSRHVLFASLDPTFLGFGDHPTPISTLFLVLYPLVSL